MGRLFFASACFQKELEEQAMPLAIAGSEELIDLNLCVGLRVGVFLVWAMLLRH